MPNDLRFGYVRATILPIRTVAEQRRCGVHLPEHVVEPIERSLVEERVGAHVAVFPRPFLRGEAQLGLGAGNGVIQLLRLPLPERVLRGLAECIACPTLVCEAEQDPFWQGQPQQLYEALTCPKPFLRFTAEEGAGEHCHVGAHTLFHERAFDWLDDVLR